MEGMWPPRPTEESPLEQPLKPDGLMGVLFLVTMPVVLYFTQPWTWEAPLYSIVAGCVGLPFLISLPIYVALRFLYVVFWQRRVSREELVAFGLTILFGMALALAFQL